MRVTVGTAFDGEVAFDVLAPAALHRGSRLLFCIPGGGVNRSYFAMPGFSFAEAMLAAGHVVMLVDPPGVGDSTRPEDGYALTAKVIATALNAVLARVRADHPGLPVIGVGHSAGAMLSVVQHDLFADFDALVLLCFGTGGLPEYFKPGIAEKAADLDWLKANLAEIATEQFGAPYLPPRPDPRETPAALAMRAVHDHVVSAVAMQSMAPGNVATELARVTVPVFMAAGDRDMTGPPHLLPAACVACPDLTLHVVADAGHHVFVVANAGRLYRRLVDWLSIIAEG
jgi:alpha-beta hydrolase superfamily lysophospholipase